MGGVPLGSHDNVSNSASVIFCQLSRIFYLFACAPKTNPKSENYLGLTQGAIHVRVGIEKVLRTFFPVPQK